MTVRGPFVFAKLKLALVSQSFPIALSLSIASDVR